MSRWPPVIERFMNNVSPEPTSGCWLWTGPITNCGYGKYGFPTKSAHRVSYELHKGKIPDGLQLDHLCRVRTCVNPDHLDPVTGSVNTLRGASPSLSSFRTRGSKHRFAKLAEEDVRDIRRRIASGERVPKIAESMSVTNGAIYAILSGRNWSHVQ